MDFLGFGKETTTGSGTFVPPTLRPVIPTGHDVCVDCDEIRPHDELTYVGEGDFDGCGGDPLYRCTRCS